MAAKSIKIVGSAILIVVLFYCILSNALQHYGPIRNIVGSLDLIFRPQIQWGVFTLVSLFCIELILFSFALSDIWLLGFLFIIIYGYSINYSESSLGTSSVNVLIAVVIGRGVVILKLQKPVVLFLIALLTGTACLHLNSDVSYYHGTPRWMGVWSDPNVYGMLMSVGTLLALGLAMNRQEWGVAKLMFLASACITAFGLVNSYSRGAWVGGVLGLIVLMNSLSTNCRKNAARVIVFFLISLLVCNLSGDILHLKNRIISVANPYDFSWGNRLIAWQNSLQIMAEYPWFGVGSGMALEICQYWYTATLLNSGALCTNSYALLGAEQGLPALICYVVYLWIALASGFTQTHRDQKQINDVGSEKFDWHGNVCRAGAIALAIGFIFDGWMFDLSVASCFWILLESGKNQPRKCVKPFYVLHVFLRKPFSWMNFFNSCQSLRFASNIFLILLFLGVLFWAKAQDPFVRKWFAVKTADGGSVKCVAVLPKPIRPRPVVIYAHGSGGDLMKDGNHLREMAEMGVVTVSLEYNQNNGVAFKDQFNALLQYIARQKWADTNAVAWVGFSLGANRTLDFALQHPERQPRLMIQLGGAGLPEDAKSQNSEVSLKCPVLLIHGEQDEIFPVADTKRLAVVLQSNGVPVKLKIISSMGHSTGADGGSVFRGIVEYCLTHFSGEQALQNYHSVAQWQAEAPPLWLFWLPAVAWAGGWLVWWKLGRCNSTAPPRKLLARSEIALRWLAVLLAIWALAETALHLVPPRLPVSQRTLDIARRFLVQPKEISDFEFLAVQPIWHGEKLKTLLTHVELAGYNRELINWQLEDAMYRDFVLSPVITGAPDEPLNWRRLLWEEFYPRIRRESSPEDAAKIVVRHLRERVTIIGGLPHGKTPGGTPGKPAGEDARATAGGLPHDVPGIWLRQITGEAGFDIICVAALRSVGVPARLGANRRAEFFDGNQWRVAPAPAVVSW